MHYNDALQYDAPSAEHYDDPLLQYERKGIHPLLQYNRSLAPESVPFCDFVMVGSRSGFL